jgi:hypothetical protein
VIPVCLYRDQATRTILWGESWEMMTPLDIVPHGCSVSIELCSFSLKSAPPRSSPVERIPAGKKQPSQKYFSQFFRPAHPLEESLTVGATESILNHPDRRVVASARVPLNLHRLDTATKTIEFHLPSEDETGLLHSCLDISVSCHCDLSSFDRAAFNLRSAQAQPEWIHHHLPLPIDGVRCGDISISSSPEIHPLRDQDSSPLVQGPPFDFFKLLHAFPSPQSSQPSHSRRSANLIDDISAADISRMTFAELKYYLDKKKINWKRYVKTMMRRALIAAKDEEGPTSP